MIFGLSLELNVSYIVFRMCRYYAQLYIRTFQTSSDSFVTVLSGWVLLTTAFHVGFLVYFGYTTSWWNPLKLFELNYVALLPITALEVSITEHFPSFPRLLSLAGFVVIPLCAVVMMQTME